MAKQNPIRVFWSELGQRFYATRHYRQRGKVAVVTGDKFDVTDDIARAVLKNDIEFTRIREPKLKGGS